eukprot:Skav203453  [mRNA]  locus=scaffold2237:42395:45888:- [translate_table: standard]
MVGLRLLCPLAEVWKRLGDGQSSPLDLKKRGDQVVDAVDGWLQSQESQLDTALKAGPWPVGGSRRMSPCGAGWATRKVARQKLDESLNWLASDADENPPVAGTMALVLCVLLAWLGHHSGYGDLCHFSATAPRIAWPQAVLSTFLLPNLPTLSSAMLLLVLFGRAVELDSGPLALCLFYITGGMATNFLCHLAMVSAPAGLAATGGLFALVFMGLAVTLKDTLRLKRLGPLVKSGPHRCTEMHESAQMP